jgi:hypothetical protein
MGKRPFFLLLFWDPLVPLEIRVGEWSIGGQKLKVVRENYLNRDEIETGMFSSWGDTNHPSMAMVRSLREVSR